MFRVSGSTFSSFGYFSSAGHLLSYFYLHVLGYLLLGNWHPYKRTQKSLGGTKEPYVSKLAWVQGALKISAWTLEIEKKMYEEVWINASFETFIPWHLLSHSHATYEGWSWLHWHLILLKSIVKSVHCVSVYWATTMCMCCVGSGTRWGWRRKLGLNHPGLQVSLELGLAPQCSVKPLKNFSKGMMWSDLYV